eukprot:Amastigsp_a340011_380.p2 type:complete len:325 gc:universal Amastigsp_a340011_380:300-1274(+)
MDRLADLEHVAGSPQNKRLVKVGQPPALLGVHPREGQPLPDLLQQKIEVHAPLAADDDRVGEARKTVQLLQPDRVELVVDVQRGDVFPVALDRVDELVDPVVAAEQNLRVVDFELEEQRRHQRAVNFRQRHRRIELDASALLELDRDVRRRSVETDADRLELGLEKTPLSVAFGRVHHDQNEIRGPGHADDLAPTAFALRRALNDPGQIEELNLRPCVVNHAGDACQRRELVRGNLRLGGGHFREQSRLAHRGEADHRHARVPNTAHVKALALPCSRLGPFDELRAILGELGLESAEMPLGRFVFLCAGHLILNLFDLFKQPHG